MSGISPEDRERQLLSYSHGGYSLVASASRDMVASVEPGNSQKQQQQKRNPEAKIVRTMQSKIQRIKQINNERRKKKQRIAADLWKF